MLIFAFVLGWEEEQVQYTRWGWAIYNVLADGGRMA